MENKKHRNYIIGTIVVVIVGAFFVQYARYANKIKQLQSGMGAVLPLNYFPFNGTFERDTNGHLKRA